MISSRVEKFKDASFKLLQHARTLTFGCDYFCPKAPFQEVKGN